MISENGELIFKRQRRICPRNRPLPVLLYSHLNLRVYALPGKNETHRMIYEALSKDKKTLEKIQQTFEDALREKNGGHSRRAKERKTPEPFV